MDPQLGGTDFITELVSMATIDICVRKRANRNRGNILTSCIADVIYFARDSSIFFSIFISFFWREPWRSESVPWLHLPCEFSHHSTFCSYTFFRSVLPQGLLPQELLRGYVQFAATLIVPCSNPNPPAVPTTWHWCTPGLCSTMHQTTPSPKDARVCLDTSARGRTNWL